jgi:hypothetical protein
MGGNEEPAVWPIIALVILLPLVIAGGVIGLVALLLGKARPADFQSRPSAASLGVEEALPQHVAHFVREEIRALEGWPEAWRTIYRGAVAPVGLVGVRAGSIRQAVRVLQRVRHGDDQIGLGTGAALASSLIGDHSFLVQKRDEHHLTGWTNGPWAFVAVSADRDTLRAFVEQFPY